MDEGEREMSDRVHFEARVRDESVSRDCDCMISASLDGGDCMAYVSGEMSPADIGDLCGAAFGVALDALTGDPVSMDPERAVLLLQAGILLHLGDKKNKRASYRNFRDEDAARVAAEEVLRDE